MATPPLARSSACAAGADATADVREHTALHLASDGYASADAVSMGALVRALLKAKAPSLRRGSAREPRAAAQLGATEVARATRRRRRRVDEDLYMPLNRLIMRMATGIRRRSALLEAGADAIAAGGRRGSSAATQAPGRARGRGGGGARAQMSTTAQAVRGSIALRQRLTDQPPAATSVAAVAPTSDASVRRPRSSRRIARSLA